MLADLPRTETGRFASKPAGDAATEAKRAYNRDRARLIRSGRWSPNRVPDARREPTEVDIAWAAGFLEGEGWFGGGNSLLVSATQANTTEPLVLLQEVFGGSIRHNRSQTHPAFCWRVSGVRARTVMDAVYDLMSTRRREQIDRARTRTAHITLREADAA